MLKKLKLAGSLGIIAAIATILGFMLSLLTTFFPQVVREAASEITGPLLVSSSGRIRAEFVSSQVEVFIYAAVLVVALGGVAMAGFYYWSGAASARSIVSGKDGWSGWARLSLLLVPALFVVLCGMFLPRQIFQPTDEVELGRQFGLLAWAVRSYLGGFVLGIGLLLFSGLTALGAYIVAVVLPRQIQSGRYQRALEKAKA